MYHKSTGHVPAKVNCLFFSRTEKHLTSDCLFFFFYLTGTLAESQMDVLVPHGVEEHRNGDQTRPLLLFIEERPLCSGSRRQTLLLFPFQPLPSKLQRRYRAMAVFGKEIFGICVLGEALEAHRSRITWMLLLFF